MKIWEAILYGIFGGATTLLPVSFSGHYALLRGAFNLSSLTEGGGYYVRFAICLGVILAIILAFPGESRTLGVETLKLTGLKKRKRRERINRSRVRSIALGFFALLPMGLSLIFASMAAEPGGLLYVALFFILNGLVLFLCFRSGEGRKNESGVLLSDMVFIGLARVLAILPGFSSVGLSLSVGRVRGLSNHYNVRVTYLLTLAFEVVSLFYHLIRAILYGSFTFSLLLPVLLAMLFATVAGYLAIQYFRYLLQRKKWNLFAYYCWDAAAIVLVLALINS